MKRKQQVDAYLQLVSAEKKGNIPQLKRVCLEKGHLFFGKSMTTITSQCVDKTMDFAHVRILCMGRALVCLANLFDCHPSDTVAVMRQLKFALQWFLLLDSNRPSMQVVSSFLQSVRSALQTLSSESRSQFPSYCTNMFYECTDTELFQYLQNV